MYWTENPSENVKNDPYPATTGPSSAPVASHDTPVAFCAPTLSVVFAGSYGAMGNDSAAKLRPEDRDRFRYTGKLAGTPPEPTLRSTVKEDVAPGEPPSGVTVPFVRETSSADAP